MSNASFWSFLCPALSRRLLFQAQKKESDDDEDFSFFFVFLILS